jgi:hypothetical protein
MPQRSNDFQKFVYLIQSQLAEEARVEESKMLFDFVAEIEREVDIVVMKRAVKSMKPVILSFECKDSRYRADVRWVEQMWAKHQHLPTNVLYLVTRGGFTEAARKKADKLSVELIDLGEALTTDWVVHIKELESTVLDRVRNSWEMYVAYSEEPATIVGPVARNVVVSAPDDSWQVPLGEMGRALRDHSGLIDVVYAALAPGQTAAFMVSAQCITGTYLRYDDATRREISKVYAKVKCSRTIMPMQFHRGTYGGVPVAYGRGEDTSGSLLLTLIEEQTPSGTTLTGRFLDEDSVYVIEDAQFYS